MHGHVCCSRDLLSHWFKATCRNRRRSDGHVYGEDHATQPSFDLWDDSLKSGRVEGARVDAKEESNRIEGVTG